MKKIFALVFSILLFNSVQATRFVDLSVKYNYPNYNSSTFYAITAKQYIWVDVVIKNVGVNALEASDVIYCGLQLDGNILYYREKIVTTDSILYHDDSTNYITGKSLAPGDTFHISKILKFNFPDVQNGYHTLCFFAVPDSISNSFNDPYRNNNVDCINVKLDNGWTSGVDDLNGSNNMLSLVPNPATTLISTNININEKSKTTMKIIDLSGRIVAEKDFGVLSSGNQNLEMSTINIPSGFYMCQVQAGDKTYNGKIVISK